MSTRNAYEALRGMTAVQAGWAFGVPEDGREQWLELVTAKLDEVGGEWLPSGWWRVIRDGAVWAETRDEEDARDRMRPGDKLQCKWVRSQMDWRDVPSQELHVL